MKAFQNSKNIPILLGQVKKKIDEQVKDLLIYGVLVLRVEDYLGHSIKTIIYLPQHDLNKGEIIKKLDEKYL